MIHGIYLRLKPKHKWQLFSYTLSAEKANKELKAALEAARKGGNESGEAVIQTFDSLLFIPELLSEVKEQKALGLN